MVANVRLRVPATRMSPTQSELVGIDFKLLRVVPR